MNRQVSAAFLALLAGSCGFTVLLLAGWLLYQRLWGDSPLALAIIIVLFGTGGAYAGWLLGMVVFSAVRGAEERPDGG